MNSMFRTIVDSIKKPYTILLSMNTKGEQFVALEQRLEETRKIEDVAERVLAAEKLGQDAREAGFNHDHDSHPMRFAFSLIPLGVLGAAIVAPFVAAPLGVVLLWGTIVGFGTSSVTGIATSFMREKKDTGLKSAQQVRNAATGLIGEASKAGNFLSIAQSPLFDNIMAKYPALKESFLLQSARSKTVQDLSAPAAPVAVQKRQLNP